MKIKFSLVGRSEAGARIGPVTFNRDDMIEILGTANLQSNVSNFQFIIEHELGVDKLKILLSLVDDNSNDKKICQTLEEIIYTERKMFKESLDKKIIAPIEVLVVKNCDLVQNPRTGKLSLVVDNRHC